MMDRTLEIPAASGGSYSLSPSAEGDELVLICIERLSARGSRIVFTLGGGVVIGLLLFGLNWVLSPFSSELLYALVMAPCYGPALGLPLAYALARVVIRQPQEATTVNLGVSVRIDGRDAGKLLRVDQDVGDGTLTLVCEGEVFLLSCRDASDVAALAEAIESVRDASTEEPGA
ncbi:MAG: hypothetical protein AB7P00_10935 [Sandaracinaceae bacterium]